MKRLPYRTLLSFVLVALTAAPPTALATDGGNARTDAANAPSTAPANATTTTTTTTTTADDVTACTPRWSTERSIGRTAASARIEDGALVLSDTGGGSTACQGDGLCFPIQVFQEGLVGDFEVRVGYEQFQAAGAFSQFALFVGDARSRGEAASAGILRAPLINNLSVTVGDEVALTGGRNSAGTLTIRRRGNSVTVTSTDGEFTNTQSGIVGRGPLRVGFMVTSTVPGVPSSVRITDFTVSGGGDAVTSDTFACDSLR